MTKNVAHKGSTWLKNFLMLVGLGFLVGLVEQKSSDLILPALVAAVLTYPDVFEHPSPRILLLNAWFQTILVVFLIAIVVSTPLRLALWQLVGGVERSAGVWAVVAGGWMLLAFASWLTYSHTREAYEARRSRPFEQTKHRK